jgi:hypothetical protein
MNAHLSLEQTKELVALSRTGQLYEIERRFTQWGTLCQHPDAHRDPLDVALEKGFHSLVELLIRHTSDQDTKNYALEQAVYNRRFDIVQMLVEYGADPLSVSFKDVLEAYNPDMMRYFIAKGADIVKEFPFAQAFRWKVRTALGVFLDCRRKFPQHKRALQRQLDMALAYHCGSGSMRWVCLLLWAGGNPLVSVPNIEYLDESTTKTSGARAAALNGRLDVIQKFRVNAKKPAWREALEIACFCGKPLVVKFILEGGVPPNDKPNGGSSGLESAMRHIDWGTCFAYSTDAAQDSVETVKLLLQHGARWVPDEPWHINAIRRALYRVEIRHTVDLVNLLITYKACEVELLRRFVSTPKMLTYLGGKIEAEALLRRLS